MWARCVRITSRSLPDYMVPSAFVVLEELAADAERQTGSQGAAGAGRCCGCPRRIRGPPHGEVEEVLALDLVRSIEAWIGLGFTTISSSLATHSLLATRLVARVRDELQVGCRCGRCLRAPSVGELALRVERRSGRPQGWQCPPSLCSGGLMNCRCPMRRSGYGC